MSGEIRILMHRWWECIILENSGQFFKMLNLEVPHDPAVPPLGIYSREVKIQVRTGLVHKYA